MGRRTRTGARAAVLLTMGLAALAGPAVAAAPRAGAAVVPNVYGPGILMAFSGLDGKTFSTAPFVASTGGEGIAFRFHLPRDPVVSVALPEGVKPVWRLVANDLLVADVPGDAVPLVVGLPSALVMVGRLPRGARVALRGGDTSAVLLRRAVGDRTVFSFSYDPAGAKASADAAARGLDVSIETLVEARTDFFASAPQAPDGTPPERARALAKAFSVLKANVLSSEAPVTVRWATPCRWPQGYMQLWGSAFAAVGLMHLDLPLAKEVLDAACEAQGEDGFIAGRLGPGQTSEISAPPLVAWAAWQVYVFDQMRDRDFLKRSYDAAAKHATWFLKKRRLEGEPPPTRPLEYGTPLYAWTSAEEAGCPGSPRFAGGAAFAAVDLSCYLVSECRTLQAMAQRLGYRELAKTWGQRGDALAAAASKHLWNAERGLFTDRKADGDFIDVRSSAGLLPLWAGIATEDQAARLKGHVTKGTFMAAAGVPSIATDDPAYKKDGWSGPAWPVVDYLVVRGLERYGFAAEAGDLRGRSLDAVARTYVRTGVLWEFYDAAGEAAPAELGRSGGEAGAAAGPLADYAPTAAVFADLLLRPKP